MLARPIANKRLSCLGNAAVKTGAAILAAVGAGLHNSVAEAAQAFVRYRPGEDAPDPQRREIYDGAYARYRELYFALKPIFENSVRAKSAVPV